MKHVEVFDTVWIHVCIEYIKNFHLQYIEIRILVESTVDPVLNKSTCG